MPKDGGWIQQQVFNAVVKSPKYNSTVLMLSYDESGGWGDHVIPYTSPEGTEDEWIVDPYDTGFGSVPMGPGKSLFFLHGSLVKHCLTIMHRLPSPILYR